MCQRPEVRQHPLLIGRDPGEQFEGAGGLENRHAPAVQGSGPDASGAGQQLCLKREVGDLGDPQSGRKRSGSEGRPGWSAMPMGVALTTPSADWTAASRSSAAATRDAQSGHPL